MGWLQFCMAKVQHYQNCYNMYLTECLPIKQEQRKFIYSAEREQSQDRKAGLKENHPKNNPHKHRVLVWICLYYI